MSESEACRRYILAVVEGASVTGPIRPLLMLAQALKSGKKGSEIGLVTTARYPQGEYRPSILVRAVASAGLSIEVIRERWRFDWSVIFALARFIGKERPDLVESHDTKCHLLVMVALRIAGIRGKVRWVAYHHGYTRTSLLVRMYRHFDRLTLNSADAVITVCKPFSQQLVDIGVPLSAIDVISNPAPAPQLPPAAEELVELRRELGVKAHARLLVCVGRLSLEKGHIDLVRCLPAIHQQCGQQVALVCVGDGPERPHLENTAQALGVDVVFAGQVADVSRFLALADVFVLPSHSEGSPLALLEAMAAACPIVATSVGGVPETLSDGVDGILVSLGDASALASAIANLLMDRIRAQQLGANARKEAGRRSVESYALKISGVHERVLKRQ